MGRLKDVRNRAAHHEIVWTRDLARDRDATTNVLRALHPELTAWTVPRVEAFDAQLALRPGWAPPPTL